MTPMIATRGSVKRASVGWGRTVSCQPSVSASAGNIGRMYEGSLEPDTLKNTKMNADQTTANRCQLKLLRPTGASVHMRRAVHRNTVSHGRMPARRMGTKYHHAPSRCASLVRKREKCSRIKKKSKNSPLRKETATNQGAAIARKTSKPPIRCSLRQSDQSRWSRV